MHFLMMRPHSTGCDSKARPVRELELLLCPGGRQNPVCVRSRSHQCIGILQQSQSLVGTVGNRECAAIIWSVFLLE